MKYLSVFKDLFGAIECPVHHKTPDIIKDADGELQLKCCCTEFRKECMFLIEKALSVMAKSK
ncbi:MAG TPA: hypothetical protein VHE59_14965 [Mucilaginibacter sp.]|nr:hypothetical protein [Mucilaginibacter sp.]